jgi:hypothetical protein
MVWLNAGEHISQTNIIARSATLVIPCNAFAPGRLLKQSALYQGFSPL